MFVETQVFLVTEYDPIFFLMPTLLNSTSGITSTSPMKKNANKSGVFQTLEQILANVKTTEDDEF